MTADPNRLATTTSAPPAKPPIWNDPVWRALFFQTVVIVAVLAFGAFLVRNTLHNMEARGIASGFDFLGKTAGFSIGELHLGMEYKEDDSYGRTFLVGLLNTLWVSMWGIFFATVVGFVIGVLRLSTNWLVAKLAMVYIEVLRNIPLLLQIFFWYFALLRPLPGPRGSIQASWPQLSFAHLGVAVLLSALGLWLYFHFWVRRREETSGRSIATWLKTVSSLLIVGVAWKLASLFTGGGLARGWTEAFFLNNRGLSYPRAIPEAGFGLVLGALAAGIAGTVFLARWARKRQDATGEQFPVISSGLGLVIGLPLVVFFVASAPLHWEFPLLTGFNFQGGATLTPEFISLVFALSAYTAAFIAEIVRAGIMAVSKGQTEAAYSVGLKPGTTLRLVIIPQALRVIIPPLTSQYLNLTKNSSLAAAIAYPDLVLVFAGTALMQTGQAVEIIAMTMGVYLLLSLLISALMNWYNRKMALVER